jgi:hypothetical protein
MFPRDHRNCAVFQYKCLATRWRIGDLRSRSGAVSSNSTASQRIARAAHHGISGDVWGKVVLGTSMKETRPIVGRVSQFFITAHKLAPSPMSVNRGGDGVQRCL